ncbi:GAF domain-containing protein [Paraburkholderia humisilvae]|uniref:PAS domain-containing protein n=1 Tax=Paraburkholderia humisilvae TaxID=627669 RepID=A0A6J5EXX4_9BURK|nr:GAF domain-containing protein [Paraburkholderia humisilvae]CAB3770092.1 hypothetical protein LMG29542_06262 [Paraburkholderia humisilvae]
MSITQHETLAIADDAKRYDANPEHELINSPLPCALVDAHDIVTDASASLKTLLPDVVGRALPEVLELDASMLVTLRTSCGPVDSSYRTLAGELMPAIVQSLAAGYPAPGMLLVVTDCARFRLMESRRFESTPYTVMRVSEDGAVRFANAETMKVLAVTQEALLGRPLTSLFSSSDALNITECLEQCMDTLESKSLFVTIPKLGGCPDEPSKLIFTPDMAPQGRPYGVLVVIESTANERVRDEIAKIALNPENSNWRERLRLVVAKIRQIIEFDHAIFGIYAEDMTLFRAAAIYEEDSIKWPERWMKLPDGLVQAFIDSGNFCIDNLEEYVEKHKALRESEVVAAYLAAEIKSSVTLIVRGPEGPTSAFTLCSKAPRKFHDADHETLRDLGVEAVLLRCEEQMKQEQRAFAEEVKQQVATTECLTEAALQIVDKIREKLKWDFAALFRVDRHLNQFQLVHQSVSDPRFREDADTHFVQNIDIGMLGDTLRHGVVRVIDNVDAKNTEHYGYLRPNRGTKSVMTIPVRLNNRVRWIFHVESRDANGFRGPDKDTLTDLIRLIEEGLEQRMLVEIKECLMVESERGVLLAGMDGDVLEMNKVAARMLGRENEQIDEPFRLSRYAFNEHARSVLDREVKTSNRRIELKGDHDERCIVLATCQELDESFDAVLWFFTDVRSIAWVRDLRFLRETVSEVARQTRTPLSLASSIAYQLQKRLSAEVGSVDEVSSNRAVEAFQRIALEIGKADITFERLADALSIRQAPMRKRVPVDLRACVEHVIDSLPERDRGHVEKDLGERPAIVMGDDGRLAFVVRSIVGYLIRTRPDEDARVRIALSAVAAGRYTGPRVRLDLMFAHTEPHASIESTQPGRPDPLQAAYDEARKDASLSLAAIRRVIQAHAGRLETASPHRDPSGNVTAFKMWFPEPLTGAGDDSN